QAGIVGAECECKRFPECRMVFLAMLLVDQVLQDFLAYADIATVARIVEMRCVEMHRAQVGGFSQNVIKILFGVMAQLLSGELAFRPGNVEGVLQQMSALNDGIDLLLECFVCGHDSSYECK